MCISLGELLSAAYFTTHPRPACNTRPGLRQYGNKRPANFCQRANDGLFYSLMDSLFPGWSVWDYWLRCGGCGGGGGDGGRAHAAVLTSDY